jgi:hypothetical protein
VETPLQRRISDLLLLMNSIPDMQNTPKQLQRLAAQRHLYSTAKRIFGVQVVLGAPLAVAWSLLAVAIPSAKSYAALWGTIVSLADLLWLTPWQKRLRESAARIQEAFDCDVLQLPWNELKVGKRPDPEIVREQADKFEKTQANSPPLTDWYPRVVRELPMEAARIVCQRSNCWWDSKQRRRYAAWVIAGVLTTSVCILGLGLVGKITVENLLLAIFLPLSPALLLGIRQFLDQTEAANRLDKLKDHAERLWAETYNGLPASELVNKCRALQDEIFENRRRSPSVFDWIFKRLRSNYETQMNHGATELVDESKRKLGLN